MQVGSETIPEFVREDRYIVIKRKDLSREAAIDLGFTLAKHDIPERPCVVVEADWPEYEPVWTMIEARMARTKEPSRG